MATRQVEELSQETLERLAKIIGPQSAAAQALADSDRRREAGEDVAFYRDTRTKVILVGPRLIVKDSLRASRPRPVALESE